MALLSSNTVKVEKVISEIESGTVFVNPYAAANVFLAELKQKAATQRLEMGNLKPPDSDGVILYDHTDWPNSLNPPISTANSYNANQHSEILHLLDLYMNTCTSFVFHTDARSGVNTSPDYVVTTNGSSQTMGANSTIDVISGVALGYGLGRSSSVGSTNAEPSLFETYNTSNVDEALNVRDNYKESDSFSSDMGTDNIISAMFSSISIDANTRSTLLAGPAANSTTHIPSDATSYSARLSVAQTAAFDAGTSNTCRTVREMGDTIIDELSRHTNERRGSIVAARWPLDGFVLNPDGLDANLSKNIIDLKNATPFNFGPVKPDYANSYTLFGQTYYTSPDDPNIPVGSLGSYQINALDNADLQPAGAFRKTGNCIATFFADPDGDSLFGSGDLAFPSIPIRPPRGTLRLAKHDEVKNYEQQTWAFWIRPTGAIGDRTRIISRPDWWQLAANVDFSSASSDGYSPGFVDGAYWDLIISGVSVSDSNPDTPADMGASAANRTLVGENILKQNVWNFIAMTFDYRTSGTPGKAKIYVYNVDDGHKCTNTYTLPSQTTASVNNAGYTVNGDRDNNDHIPYSNGAVCLSGFGNRLANRRIIKAMYSDARFYSTILTDPEVDELFYLYGSFSQEIAANTTMWLGSFKSDYLAYDVGTQNEVYRWNTIAAQARSYLTLAENKSVAPIMKIVGSPSFQETANLA